MGKNIMGIIGIILCLGSVVFGLYMGLWVCLVGGIVMVVEAVKADPVNSMGIALGIVRVLLASLIGWLSFLIGWVFGAAFVRASEW